MDIVINKLILLDKALRTLEEVLNDQQLTDAYRRDLLVLRFLYTSELFYKTLRTFLREQDVEIKYPGDVYRQAQTTGLMSPEETETALQMIKDRNFCAHAYQETVVGKIAQSVPLYAAMMRNIYAQLQHEVGS